MLATKCIKKVESVDRVGGEFTCCRGQMSARAPSFEANAAIKMTARAKRDLTCELSSFFSYA